MIEGISGNPSRRSDDEYVEEKDKKEILEVSKDDLTKNVKESYDKYEENGSMITYQEFDVNNKVAGQVRDNVRFVVGNDESIYYTGDHYNFFV